jgi:hypothetical protein
MFKLSIYSKENWPWLGADQCNYVIWEIGDITFKEVEENQCKYTQIWEGTIDLMTVQDIYITDYNRRFLCFSENQCEKLININLGP